MRALENRVLEQNPAAAHASQQSGPQDGVLEETSKPYQGLETLRVRRPLDPFADSATI